MPDTPNDRPSVPGTTPEPGPSYKLPSNRRTEALILALTTAAGVLGGIVLTLTLLSLGTPALLWLLGILILVGALAVFFLLMHARARLENTAAEWERQRAVEREAQDAAQRAQREQIESQRAQIELLETNLAHLNSAPAQILPVIRGWEALGISEQELAPQLQILTTLFRGHSRILIQKKFNGGHRNRGVYQIRSSGEADRIVKIARSSDIRAERQAQEWMNQFSQNNGAQYVRDISSDDDDAPGGIVYRLSALRRNAELVSLEMFYRETHNPILCAQIIEQLYSETLPHSEFRKAQTIPLLREYALPERVLERIENALAHIPSLAHVTRADASARVVFENRSYRVRNPLHWAHAVLPTYFDAFFPVACGVIHGDLHSGNVLVEPPMQALWLIDFGKTRQDAPTLLDYARLETDLKFFLLPDGAADYARVAEWEEQLLAPRIATELEPAAETAQAYGEEIQKAHACVAALRRVAVNHDAETQEHPGHFIGDSILPYYLALWHTTMRTLYYTQCSAAQKTFAFLSAAWLSECISQLLR